jgi:hypothetical protein
MAGALKPMVNTPGLRRLQPLFLRSFSKVCGLLIKSSLPSSHELA